jgi:tetratricopeptide (TPR) repeat protein
LLVDLSRHAEALEQLRAVLSDSDRLGPALPLLKSLAGSAPDETRAFLQAALGASPKNSLLAVTLGEFYVITKDNSEAATFLKAALDRDTENADLAIRLMRAALGLSTDDKVADAIEIGERFLAKEPTKEFAKLLVGLYLRLPSSADVEDGLDRVFAHFEDDSGLLVQLAAGYLSNSNLAKAEATLARAVDPQCSDSWQGDPSLLLMAAKVERKLSRPERAIDYIEKCIDLAPSLGA